MAVAKYGSIITELKGLIGGHIFQAGTAGQIIRLKMPGGQKRKFINPRFSASAMQYRIAYLSSAWKGLSSSQQTSFATYAASYPFTDKYGNSYTPSPYMLFMKLNMQLFASGNSILNTCVSPGSAPSVSLTNLNITGTSSIVLNMNVGVPSGYTQQIYISAPCSKGRSRPPGGYKLISSVAAGGSGSQNLTSLYSALFGGLVAGSKYFLRTRYVYAQTGQAFAYLSVTATN